MSFSGGFGNGSNGHRLFNATPGPTPTALLDKNKVTAGIRRSTPDSEALASSDDEREPVPPIQPAQANPTI
ncbi:hypothetical protein LTR66_014344, partial [Elasticomyces elasticus]